MKISRKLAIQILKYCFLHKDFYFPFLVMCREYSPEDDDFVEIEPNEWETISEDENYHTFELWENLQNLYEQTLQLMAKGFIDKITERKISTRYFIFYTTEGFTFQLKIAKSWDGEMERMQKRLSRILKKKMYGLKNLDLMRLLASN
ncbi:MAG: hypothetical protein UR83_C0066G0005 [Candidatus Moranbacteria bacterium GW2011_GWF2_35_54]|nr:MAG: hypothetical protein UR83_C0066G0005 [Candidatus Moranbacteria bacterium GW2011_GWF2_35_54]